MIPAKRLRRSTRKESDTAGLVEFATGSAVLRQPVERLLCPGNLPDQDGSLAWPFAESLANIAFSAQTFIKCE
jgi:hypothetical protein